MAQVTPLASVYEAEQFTGDNLADVLAVLRSPTIVADQPDPQVLTGDEDADPELRIAGKRYFRWDFDGNNGFEPGDSGYIDHAHIVEGDWVVWERSGPRGAASYALRYYPEQYAEVFSG